MKNILKFAIILAVLFSNTGIQASTPQQNFEIELPTKEYNTSFEQPKVIIRNKKGIAIYETESSVAVSKNDLIGSVNLSEGKYTFEIDQETKVEITPFTVGNGTVLMNEEKTKTIFKPTVRVKDNVVLVNQLSMQKEPLKIIFYYIEEGANAKDSEVIQADMIRNKTILQRVYNLDESKTGFYKVELISDGKVFTTNFNFLQ